MTNYASIDYYTATTESKNIGEQWFVTWDKYRESCVKEGAKVKAAKRWGYDCVYISDLTWGHHQKNGYLMTSSGQVAGLTWSSVLPTSRRVTRVDFQYTFVVDGGIDLRQVYDKWEEQNTGSRIGTIMHNTTGGQTLYVGSRRSDQYGRFYNKSIESGMSVENVFRLEVEVKKPRADAVLDSLYDDMKRCSISPELIRDYVLSWFDHRGVTTLIDFNKVQPVQLAKSMTSDHKKLVWLRTSVAPTINDLMQRGLCEELTKALGLSSTEHQQMALFSADEEFKKLDVGAKLGEMKDQMEDDARNR